MRKLVSIVDWAVVAPKAFDHESSDYGILVTV
jgi:hypothetical protein